MTKWVAKLQMTEKEIKPLFSDSLEASRNLPVQTLHIVHIPKVSQSTGSAGLMYSFLHPHLTASHHKISQDSRGCNPERGSAESD